MDNEQMQKIIYGKYKGYYRWDLAKDWLQMSNDYFYETYDFNWVPDSELREEVRKYL